MVTDNYTINEMLDQKVETKYDTEILNAEHQERKNKVNVGKLDKDNIVLFIDEPTAFCKDINSKATRTLFNILANFPPKIIILASATMPEEKHLAKTIELIRRKNKDLKVVSVESKEFQVGCQFCSFKGEIIFPHSGV